MLSANVKPSKVWFDDLELLDFADIDAAGQPLAVFNANSVGSAQLSADAIAKKLALIGGPGRVFQFVFPAALLTIASARFSQLVGQMDIPAVDFGDFVIMGELMDQNGIYVGLTNALIRNVVFFGSATNNVVRIYAWNGNGGTIPANSRVNFRLFGYP